MWRSDFIRWTICWALALMMVGALRVRQDAIANSRSQRLRIGYLANVTHAAELVGVEEGIFRRAVGRGVQVEPRIFTAGNELVTAVGAGEIDVACMGAGPALIAEAAGVPLVPLAGAAYGGSVLVRRKGSPLHSPRDLDGRRVTVPKYGNTQDILLRTVLREAGLKDRALGGTVEILQAEGADALAMLRQGQIDASMFPEPWGARSQIDVGAEILLDAEHAWSAGRYPSAILVASQSYARKYPERVAQITATHRALLQELASQGEQGIDRTNEAFGKHAGRKMRPAVIQQAFSRMELDAELDTASIRRFAETMQQMGYLRAGFVESGQVESWLGRAWASR